MATRNFVPRKDGEGSVGKASKHWGAGFFDKIFVKTIEVLGDGAEDNNQPATVGWVKTKFYALLRKALEVSGVMFYNTSNTTYGVFGYIILGDFFGGFTIQWVESVTVSSSGTDYVYPIAFKDYGFMICGSSPSNDKSVTFVARNTKNKAHITHSENTGQYTTYALAIGR